MLLRFIVDKLPLLFVALITWTSITSLFTSLRFLKNCSTTIFSKPSFSSWINNSKSCNSPSTVCPVNPLGYSSNWFLTSMDLVIIADACACLCIFVNFTTGNMSFSVISISENTAQSPIACNCPSSPSIISLVPFLIALRSNKNNSPDTILDSSSITMSANNGFTSCGLTFCFPKPSNLWIVDASLLVTSAILCDAFADKQVILIV